MKYKLIVSDLDGTLIPLRSETLSTKTREIVSKIVESGVYFVPCTGRSFNCIPKEFEDLGTRFYIYANGAVIYDKMTHSFLRENYIELDCALSVIDILKKYGILVYTFIDKDMYTDKFYFDKLCGNEEFSYFFSKATILDDLSTYIMDNKAKVQKISATLNPGEYDTVYQTINNIIPGLTITSFTENNIEILSEGSDKGTALCFLCDSLEINNEECAALGDSDNDIEMIKNAGLSIAPINANDNVKMIANIIEGDANNDTFADTLMKYIF